MATQGFSDGSKRAGTAAGIVAALLVISLALLYAVRRDASKAFSKFSSRTPSADTASLRAAADAGDATALAALVDGVNGLASTTARAVVVADMLRSARPEVRAAACAWIGRNPQPNLPALLVPRMSDADWRVRAAAFDAARRVSEHLTHRSAERVPHAPWERPPLRDTPVDQREDLVFAWINGLRRAELALPDHCELYAPAGGNWLVGTRLARSCLACHAPPDVYPSAAFERCADCHQQTHAEWAGSSHAQSATHLNLLRVDERTKQVERVDPGPRQGLVCTSCHVVDAAPNSASPAITGTKNLPVPHRFKAGTAAALCAGCHAETQTEWQAWRRNPRPTASTWLPGEFTWDEEPDTRTCVSCHMQARPAPPGGLTHSFASRRDATLMRGGLSARIEPPAAGRGAQLVLTNLAGHRYPSGTIRRALRIELRYDNDDGNAAQRFTRLTDSMVPALLPTQPALAPGEQRRLDLPIPSGASRVTCTITYERNQFESGAYELPLHTVTERIIAPIAGSDDAVR